MTPLGTDPDDAFESASEPLGFPPVADESTAMATGGVPSGRRTYRPLRRPRGGGVAYEQVDEAAMTDLETGHRRGAY